VALTAARADAAVVTTDIGGITHLLQTLGGRVAVLSP
jgi:hypothetical protein